MSYRKLVLAFGAAALTGPFMSGPAYSCCTGSTFPLQGLGSFAYDCASNSPVGSNFTFDDVAQTFTANVGALTCVFTLTDGSTVTVPFNLNVTYNNANVQPVGSTTTVAATCPTATYGGSFTATGPCVGTSTACSAWSSQLPGGQFFFQTPWVGLNTNKAQTTCDTIFPAGGGLDPDALVNWSVTTLPGETDATAPLFRFCATPLDTSTGQPEPCSETTGTGRDKTLYVRGASGSGVIRLIGDAQAVNKWNVSNPQQGNYNVQYNPTADVDPHNLVDIKVEGVLNTGCSDFGTYIQCKFPAQQLAPILQPRVVNGQVSITGTAETSGGTAVIFFFTAQTN